MPESSFTYLRLHEAVQTADIDGDGILDIVVLADGNLPQTDDFITAGGAITGTDYLFGKGGPGKESPNVRSGQILCCSDPAPRGSMHLGSDLAWYKGDGFNMFYPVHVTPGTTIVRSSATIYNGKNLEAINLDEDRDTDMIVWCSTGTDPSDRDLGAGRVTWFENRLSQGDLYPPYVLLFPVFFQHDVVTPTDSGYFYVAPTSFSVSNPRAGTIADMDGDTRLDLIVYNSTGTVVAGDKAGLFWLSNSGLDGVAKFPQANATPVLLTGAGKPFKETFGSAVVAADLDGGGGMDLVLGENGEGPSPGGDSDRELIFLRRIPSGRFEKKIVQNNFFVPKSMAVSDIRPGGCQEIIAGGKFVAADGRFQSALSVFGNANANCTGAWTRWVLPTADTMPEIWDIRMADLNGDGLPDILAFSVGNTGHPSLAAGQTSLATFWINQPGVDPDDWPSFPLIEPTAPPAMTTNGGGLAWGDFDGDTDIDLVRAHFETNLAFFENVWNTERQIQITTKAKKNGVEQKVISVFGTKVDGTLGRMIKQKDQSK